MAAAHTTTTAGEELVPGEDTSPEVALNLEERHTAEEVAGPGVHRTTR